MASTSSSPLGKRKLTKRTRIFRGKPSRWHSAFWSAGAKSQTTRLWLARLSRNSSWAARKEPVEQRATKCAARCATRAK